MNSQESGLNRKVDFEHEKLYEYFAKSENPFYVHLTTTGEVVFWKK
jgi:hypothetical protein